MNKFNSCEARERLKAIQNLRDSVNRFRDELSQLTLAMNRWDCQACKYYKNKKRDGTNAH